MTDKKNKEAEEQYKLGLMYYNGQDIDQDYKQAFEWFAKSAAQGHADAQHKLSHMYMFAQGVKRDCNLAFEWSQKLAEQGHAKAQCNLANLYEQGEGVAQNYWQALKWYEKSAEQGFDYAQHKVGVFYKDGLGGEKNHREALKWFSKSAEQGNADSQYNCGFLILFRNNKTFRSHFLPTYDYASEQYEYELRPKISENRSKIAFEYFSKSAEQGHVAAQYYLGLMYYAGLLSVDQDYKQAFEWFTKSAEQGNAKAQYWLGSMYRAGKFVKQDYKKALDWLEKSAEQGHAGAQCYAGYICGTELMDYHAQSENCQPGLGQMYESGRERAYGPIDSKKAFECYKKSAEQGHDYAQYQLGYMCYFGAHDVAKHYEASIGGRGHEYCPEESDVVKQDLKKAFKCLEKSAEQGHAFSQWLLGRMYKFGKGVKQDNVKAYTWLKISLINGYDAKEAIEELASSMNSKLLAQVAKIADIEVYKFFNKLEEQGKANAAEQEYEDWAQSFESCLELAMQGFAPAQYKLAIMSEGIEDEGDYYESLYWYTKSAEQGFVLSQYKLGSIFYNSVKYSIINALHWYTKSAEQGFAPAQHKLGLNYKDLADDDYSYIWESDKKINDFYKAARHSLGLKHKNLADCKYDDDEDDDEYVQYKSDMLELAYAWFIIYQINGHEDAKDVVDDLKEEIIHHNNFHSTINAIDIEEAEKCARAWKPQNLRGNV